MDSPEARQALRAEKIRIYEATRSAMENNRSSYRMQLEVLEREYRTHRDNSLSARKVRHTVSLLHEALSKNDEKKIVVTFGNNKRCTITFD